MPEIIQNWLGTKLGILIDMTPNKFARHTKDGKLLAQLLYNYGVIPAHVFNKVKESKNFYECYNNFIILKPWLKHIGVIHDDCTLQKIAGGEGSPAISLFYSVYLALEKKDRLHYLSAQKERRMSLDACQKFKVTWVPERFVSGESGDSELEMAQPLHDNPDVIAWHKAKCKQIVEHIKRTKARFCKVVAEKPELGPVVSKHATSKLLSKKLEEVEQTREDITAFEKSHPYETHNLNYAELTEMQNMSELQPCFIPNMSEGKNMINTIKRRKRGEVYSRNFQQKMQNILLDEQWKELMEEQERNFESRVCENLLKQSQYEKQMATKLYLLRNQKRVIAENRRKIDCLKIDQCQKEYDETPQRNLELKGEYWEDEEVEKERIQELHRRLYDEKVLLRRELIRVESRKIYETLVNIAIRISEYREYIGCLIPKALMKDLKEIFYKDLPIFDILDHLEDLHLHPQPLPCEQSGEGDFLQGETDFYQNDEMQLLRCSERERQTFLDECDFNDYLYLMGPWMVELLLPNGPGGEGKQLVLGYVVHKLLAFKYPSPNVPVPTNLKPMKPTSVVLGLYDETAINMFVDLMELSRILVVKVDDAINFVLTAYKEELSVVRDIDITFQNLTVDALEKKNTNGRESDLSKKLQLLKTDCLDVSDVEEGLMVDKEVQTPRMIPEDDPLLTPNAELGKLAFEALGAGDPVPDSVIAPAVVAYIISKQDDYDGWIILNYPLLYSQASDLECALIGCRTLPLLDDMGNLEDVERFSYRGPWGNSYFKDEFGDSRFSKLVPRPEIFDPSEKVIPKTYFDCLIKMQKIFGTPRRQSLELEEFGPMEKFYLDLDILFDFEYQALNFQTVKDLGKQILGVGIKGLEIMRTASFEIFGPGIFELNDKYDPKKKGGKEPPGGLKKVSNVKVELGSETGVGEMSGEGMSQDKVVEMSVSLPQPGDPMWEWATGPLSDELQEVLVGLWENMETVYIEDFKNLFFCLRVHRANTYNYCGYVRNSLRTLMRRPDEKQKVLADFQEMFNSIDEDLRPDVDIKCELHVRVSELEQALMSIADERKKNSLRDATKVAQDGWVPDEVANLVNIFLSALQLEADRCIDSCQVIMDYYGSLQQRTMDAKPIGKLTVPKVQIQNRKYSISSTISNRSPRASDSKRRSDQSNKTADKLSKTRSLAEKRRRSSESGLIGAAEFIGDILTNLSLPEDGLTPFHTFFIENVQLVTNEVKTIVENCISESKKSDKQEKLSSAAKNPKKPSETYVPPSNENVTQEWLTALLDELSRFLFRSQLILARGVFDMNEFLMMILNILSTLSEEINEMYMKEIQSISECCKVFKCGIEEEIRIRPTLELNQEEFFIHVCDDLSSTEEISQQSIPEEERRLSFNFQQLNWLFLKLQRVAPKGEIVKRSLVFIFEDLRVMNPEMENCFPEIWTEIEPDDVTTILNEVFQDLEIVHWKDFLIYAMELPLPTEAEILSMRKAFRRYDPLVMELISRENYDCVTLWFEKYTDDVQIKKSKLAKNLLFYMYQVDEFQMNYSALLLAFCKDVDPEVGFAKALALAMGKPIKKYDETPTESVLGEMQGFDYNFFDDSNTDSLQKPPCCPTDSTGAMLKCIPKERIRCECKMEPKKLEEETTEDSELNFAEGFDQGEGIFDFVPKLETTSSASLIPLNILSNLLKASFPAIPQLSILLDCQHTLQETLTEIYDSLGSFGNALELPKLLRHEFIRRLLHSTNKFKFVDLKKVLLSVAKPKAPLPRALCVTEKPKVSFCLRN